MTWRSHREEFQKHCDVDGATTNGGEASKIPAKHILELVLDTLQRRDAYELFAEPVDPEEVEDYYDIIKKPMDFATMRAKVHEGLYENLEQFEQDVFLIPENAMHFNPSGSVYFRQARTMQELAKKVLHALKKDPENFVLEFSGPRRRSMRKALSQSKDSRFVAAKKSVNVSNCDDFPKRTSSAFHRRSSKKFARGSRDSRVWSSVPAADRRLTYFGWRSSPDQDNINPASPDAFRPLLLLQMDDEGETSYQNSLMSFVKDLGPTVQMVAWRKLLGEHKPSNTCNKTLFHSPSNPNSNNKSGIIDLSREDADADEAGKQPPAATPRTGIRLNSHSSRASLRFGNITEKDGQVVVAGNHRSNKKRGRGYKSRDRAKPVILALENSHSKGVADLYKLRSKKSTAAAPTHLTWSSGSEHGLRNSVAPMDGGKKPSVKASLTSRFVFDLPFLKAKLNQMNAREKCSEPFKKRSLLFYHGGQ